MSGVLVVGAGPTGLTMAIELARRDVTVRLIDKLAVASDRSRALVIQARSLEVLAKSGVAAALLERGQRALGLSIVVEGRLAAEVDVDDIAADDTPYPFLFTLPQDETEGALAARATALGVTIERGVELVSLAQDAAGVTTTLRDAAGAKSTWSGDFLVGCDGAHSRVRKELGLKFEGAPYANEFLLADARLEGWPFAFDRLTIFVGRAGFLAHFPLRGAALSRLIASRVGREGPRATGAAAEGTTAEPVALAEAQAAAQSLTGTHVKLADAVWLTNFRLHHRTVDRYGVGRVFLAGDAAHIHSPAGGQGMNTGIQDAWNLAWKIALVAGGAAPASLLASYHTERHPIGLFLLRGTDRIFAMMVASRPLVVALRSWLLPWGIKVLMRAPRALRRRGFRFVSQLAIRYGENDWIAPGCGERAPDARMGTTSVFAAISGTAHHVLVFAPNSARRTALAEEARTHAAVAAPRLPVEVVPVDGEEARTRYRAAKEGLVLIRPDGHVSWRGGDAVALAAHLRRWSV